MVKTIELKDLTKLDNSKIWVKFDDSLWGVTGISFDKDGDIILEVKDLQEDVDYNRRLK